MQEVLCQVNLATGGGRYKVGLMSFNFQNGLHLGQLVYFQYD